ncbi:MAG: mechanosensitive ion channel domain-containing protein [Bacteroidota bacterium]
MKKLLEIYLSDINSWLILAIVLVVFLIISFAICWFIFRLLRWSGRNLDKTSLYNIAIRRLEAPITYFISLFLAINSINAVPLSNESAIFPFTETASETIQLLLRLSLYVIGAWALMRFISIFIKIIEEQNNINTENNLHQRKVATQLQFIRKISAVIIVVVATSLALLEFEEVRKIGAGLLTSAGVAGIIIGFAAQKSIANLLAGLQIAFTQPIRIDDVVIIEGEFGRVEEITLTYVVVRLWDQRRMITPLNYFIEQPFQNWTRLNSELLGSVFIYADYDLPIEPLREELNKITENHPLWDGRVRNVLLTDLTENVMKIRILVSAKSSGDAFDLRCFVREHMVTFIQQDYPNSLPKTRVEMLPVGELDNKTSEKSP